jgi:glycosyltransferase involved in cell wall biosynthesis
MASAQNSRHRVCVVGAGTRFLSGMSYYTTRLSNSLAVQNDLSVIPMRQLLPTFLYPGRGRVGARLTDQFYDEEVRVFGGVDWYWMPSILGAIRWLTKERPEFVVFQWWTGTVLHTYLLLALTAKLIGAHVVVEFHEVLDTGEAKMPLVWRYVRLFLPVLLKMASGFVVHSAYDHALLRTHLNLDAKRIKIIPVGPFDHYQPEKGTQPKREAPENCCNLLFFGVIRPFKGLEDLLQAFDLLEDKDVGNYWLTVVGETWEGWTLPNDLIAKSRYRDRITFVNRYVSDRELAVYLDGADAVVLPYHRSSTSGPLQTAMSLGLPVVVTSVGGLIEAAEGYEGAIFVPPQDPVLLSNALKVASKLRGRRFGPIRTWQKIREAYDEIFHEMSHTK